MTRVWDTSPQKSSALLLTLALADNANDSGLCWPGTTYLAQKIRMSERQTIRLIDQLATDGEIYIEKPLRYGRGSKTLYVILSGLDQAQIAVTLQNALDLDEAEAQQSAASVWERVTSCQKDDKSAPKGDKLSERVTSEAEKGDTVKHKTPITVEPSLEPSLEPSDSTLSRASFNSHTEEINPLKNEPDPTPKVPQKGSPQKAPMGEKVVQPHIALIDAWLSALPARPAVKNVYTRYVGVTAPMAEQGITPDQVREYVTHLRRDPFWRGKLVTLEHVASNISTYLAEKERTSHVKSQTSTAIEYRGNFAASGKPAPRPIPTERPWEKR